MLCHWPGAVDRFAEWKELGDIVATDLYPIPREKRYSGLPNKDITQMRAYLEHLRKTHGDKPRMLVLQAWSWHPLKFGRKGYPTPAESRFMAYQAVVHGAKGILYYGQYHSTKPNSAASLCSQAEDPDVREKEFQQSLELNREFWDEHKPFFKELEQASKIFLLRDADEPNVITFTPADRDGSIFMMTKKSGEHFMRSSSTHHVRIPKSGSASRPHSRAPSSTSCSRIAWSKRKRASSTTGSSPTTCMSTRPPIACRKLALV